MREPLDEDAPLAATVAADAVTLLTDATASSVGYPGLSGAHDAEEIIAQLARLSEQLQQAVNQLDGYLNEQLTHSQLIPANSSHRIPADAIEAAHHALQKVRAQATALTGLLNTAELAMLDVKSQQQT